MKQVLVISTRLSLAAIALVAAVSASAATVASEPAAAKPDLSFFKDTKNCANPGKVVSAKADKAHNGVVAKVKLNKGGKVISSTASGTTDIKEFPVGSGFCAQDYDGDGK